MRPEEAEGQQCLCCRAMLHPGEEPLLRHLEASASCRLRLLPLAAMVVPPEQ